MQYKDLFKKLSTTLLLFPLIFPLCVSAIDPTTSGRILDNFKKEEERVLFDSLPLTDDDSATLLEHEYALWGLSALKDRLNQLQSTYTTKKDMVTEKRKTLEEAIASIETAISNTQNDIDRTEWSIRERDKKILQYRELSIDMKAKIDKNRSIILSYLANIYSEENLLFSDNNTIDIFQSMILSDGSVDDIATDVTYKSLISVLWQNFIIEYRKLVREYGRNALNLQEEIESLAKEQDILLKQKSNLDIQKKSREELLDVTKWQEALFEKYIASQQEAQEAVEKSWQEVNDAYTDSFDTILNKNGCSDVKKNQKITEKCENILIFYKNEQLLKSVVTATGTSNIFTWPVTPKRLSTYFHDPEYYRSLHSQHEGIDIPLSQGTDIVAPADGYVNFILPPVPGGYSYMALKHPDWYVTVYGHLSEVLVTNYQFVKKGDLIARSGGAVGTPGAGPMTSGPHLHFEIWKNRTPIDPLRVLTTVVLTYTDIPSQYQDKYIADVIEKSGSIKSVDGYTKKFSLKWESEIERQKYLLKTYATREFQDWDLWNDTALEAGIDPSFLMCVGLAETTLWNRLKTPYNIGNVGNTDSGATKTFTSSSEWLRWMVATFNNKYLRDYVYVSQLSRWWNTDGTIYASSNFNWHNNNIRCLSALKGRWVEDDYPFRVK